MLHLLAEEHDLPIINNLPHVGTEHLSRYNKSKLNITNQWASHPSVKDRIHELEKLNIIKNTNNPAPAILLFRHTDQLQTELTKRLFSGVNYAKIPVDMETQEFIEKFTAEYKKTSFSKFFNNYYDSKNPPRISSENISSPPVLLPDLFNDYIVDQLYTTISLENDLNILRQIANDTYRVKSFDYDGMKYPARECKKLIPTLEKELHDLKQEILRYDERIYAHFLKLATDSGQETILTATYESFLATTDDFARKYAFYTNLSSATNFFHETTRYELIEEHILALKNFENDLKKYIQELLKNEQYQLEMNTEMKTNFSKYVHSELIYFKNENYDTVSVNILLTAIHHFHQMLSKIYFLEKQRFLNYLEQLQRSTPILPSF